MIETYSTDKHKMDKVSDGLKWKMEHENERRYTTTTVLSVRCGGNKHQLTRAYTQPVEGRWSVRDQTKAYRQHAQNAP